MVSQSILVDAKLVYRSRAFRDVLRRAEKAALCDLSVLLRGESGVGKNRLARIIHELSSRRNQPFVLWSVPQAAPTLVQCAVFGVVKGAYTGADRDSEGVIEKAGKGTLFIDEIDKAPMELQTSLLRVLDEGTYWRVGSTETRTSDSRFLFATSRDLETLAEQGRFLPDLTYRLRVLTIDIPPLRERSEDIPPIVRYFAARGAAQAGSAVPRFSDEAMELLTSHPWPGNVREVAGVVLNLVVWGEPHAAISGPEVRQILHPPKPRVVPQRESEIARLRRLPTSERRSREVITQVLHLVGGRGVDAARALEIPLRTFRRLLHQHGMTRKEWLDASRRIE